MGCGLDVRSLQRTVSNKPMQVPESFEHWASAFGVPATCAASSDVLFLNFLEADGGTIAEMRMVKLTNGLNLYKLDLITQLLLKMITEGKKDFCPSGRVADEEGSSPLATAESSSMRRRGGGEPVAMVELEIAKQLEEEDLGVLQALEEEMMRIAAIPPLIPEIVKDLLIAPLISAGMAVMYFDGPWSSAMLALPLGLIPGLFKMLTIGRSNPLVSYLFELFLCLTVGFIAALIAGSQAFPSVCFGTLGLSGIVWYIPGLQLVLSTMELATRDTSAGSSRLVHAIFKVLLMGALPTTARPPGPLYSAEPSVYTKVSTAPLTSASEKGAFSLSQLYRAQDT